MAEILAISVPVLTIVFFVWFFMRMRRPRKPKVTKDDDHTRLERAVWAWAKILSSSQEPVNTYHVARVALQLEVHMPGTPAYEASTTWLVEQESLAFVEEGKEVSLKVDPLAPQYVYPNGGWAKFVE